MGLRGLRYTPASLTPGKGPGVHSTGGWVGPGAGLEGYRKFRPHRRSNRALCGPSQVNINDYAMFGGEKTRRRQRRRIVAGRSTLARGLPITEYA